MRNYFSQAGARKIFLCGFLYFLFAGLSMPLKAEVDPRKLVENTTQEMMDVLVKEKESLDSNPDHIYVLVERILLPHFDFVGMSRFAVGKHWKTASETQKDTFTAAFRDLLVRTYAGALRNYTGKKITFLPERESDRQDNKILIRSEVESAGPEPLLVNYRLWQKGEDWKVYDISVEGVSLLTNFRTQLSNEVSQFGLDETIRKMREKRYQVQSKLVLK